MDVLFSIAAVLFSLNAALFMKVLFLAAMFSLTAIGASALEHQTRQARHEVSERMVGCESQFAVREFPFQQE